jgi:hypothetical protein
MLVTAPYRVPDGMWVATTLAPGSVSPLLSTTLPVILEVETPCANAKLVAKTSKATARTLFSNDCLISLFFVEKLI